MVKFNHFFQALISIEDELREVANSCVRNKIPVIEPTGRSNTK